MLQATQIQLSFTLVELLTVILVILAIVALFFLVKVLIGLSKTMKGVSTILEDNKDNIDLAIKNLSETSTSAVSIASEVDGLVKDVKPGLVSTLTEVEGVVGNANKLSTDAVDTVEYFTMSAVDTFDNISSGVSKATDYIELFKSVLQSLKKMLS